MNTTASYSSEHSWLSATSRRGSTETILSIQGKETDFVRDTTDTESLDSEDERELEYEPVTDPEEEGVLSGDSSGNSDNEIISTKVIAVSVGDDGDLEFADSEQDNSDSCDSEMDLFDYWRCAQCHTTNNNPLYRYCEKCFKVRKNFFPPRPKRKQRRVEIDVSRCLSQDSGVVTAGGSQDLSQDFIDNSQPVIEPSGRDSPSVLEPSALSLEFNDTPTILDEKPPQSPPHRAEKRRAESADRADKRTKLTLTALDTSDSDSDSNRRRKSKSVDPEIKPLVKTISDPSLTVQDVDRVSVLTKKGIANTLKEKIESKDNLCIICCTEPKSGVFVHGRIAHICCCYKCAVRVWSKAKRCPVCNCKVSNVLKAVIM